MFAYGSLMWRPDFIHAEVRAARLMGWHRAMCILSTHYRGTPERPGLVLGLDRGGSCVGRAFRVEPGHWDSVRHILHEREMVTGVYRPRFLPVTLDDGRREPAYAFIVERGHHQYFSGPPEAAIRLIRQGEGPMGTSRDYLASTIAHMDALGIREGKLHRLLGLVDRG